MSELLNYQEVLKKTKTGKRHLLLGNGFSMAYEKERFSFTNLLESAIKEGIIKKASPIYNLFLEFGTSDFELIIKQLESSSIVLKSYSSVSKNIIDDIEKDANALKHHLVEIVTNNHPEKSTDIKDSEYLKCIDFVKRYDSIFTLNYDSLLYWVAMHYLEIYEKEKNSIPKEQKIIDEDTRLLVNDGFADKPGLDKVDYVIYRNDGGNFYQTIHFLHGALHIFDKQYEIIKNTFSKTEKPLKEQTLENLDKSIYPIFISEGTANKKLARIIHNSYLNNSYKTLRTMPYSKWDDKANKKLNNSLVIFGTMLKNNDSHIIDAIVKNDVQDIYIGISSPSKISEFTFLESQLEGKRKLHFYDYTTVKIWRK